jgi:hypothetical protein
MLRFDGTDGQPVEGLTIHCDQDDARFLIEMLRDLIESLEGLAKPGAVGAVTLDFARSRPTGPASE